MSIDQFSNEIRPDIRYEVVLLGPNVVQWHSELERELSANFVERMLDPDVYLSLRTSSDFDPVDDGNIRVGVWMGAKGASNAAKDLEVLDGLIVAQIPVFPVVDSIVDYQQKVPSQLYPINGLEWAVHVLASELMASFRLTRSVRRAFISYRRTDCCAIAIQLFEELSKKGYEVFLDTASVPPGVNFQNSLWCRMSNVDLLIFLDSPNALDSDWVYQELARAHDLGLGVLQLVWPDHLPFVGTELCDRFSLNDEDFSPSPPTASSKLTDPCLKSVLQASERSRIRSLSHRRRRLSDTVTVAAESCRLDVAMHPVCPFELRKGGLTIAHLLPHIGLPDGRNIQDYEKEIASNRCRQAVNKTSIMIFFDGLGMDPVWGDHLQWMNSRNPIPASTTDQLVIWMRGIAP